MRLGLWGDKGASESGSSPSESEEAPRGIISRSLSGTERWEEIRTRGSRGGGAEAETGSGTGVAGGLDSGGGTEIVLGGPLFLVFDGGEADLARLGSWVSLADLEDFCLSACLLFEDFLSVTAAEVVGWAAWAGSSAEGAGRKALS